MKFLFNHFHEILVYVSKSDGLLQLHQDFTTYEQHSSVRVWNICLQPHLCLHSKFLYETVPSAAVTSCGEPDQTCTCLFVCVSKKLCHSLMKKSQWKTLYTYMMFIYQIAEKEHVKSDAYCFLPLSPLTAVWLRPCPARYAICALFNYLLC